MGKVFSDRAYAQSPAIVDPKRWKIASQAVHIASETYRNAASSSGLLTTQQIRATSAAEQYTKALQKQKLSFKDMKKHSGVMKEVYRDQLRYQRMSAQFWGTDMSGRAITDITIPKNVPRDLDTMAQRTHFFAQQMKSAGTQVVNLGKNMQWAGRQLTVGLTYPMALFGAAAGMMAYKTEDAFAKINKVYDYSSKALTNQNVLIGEQTSLRADSMVMIKQVADEYGLGMTKTLAVEQELAATGKTIANGLLETTKEVQRISALGGIDPEQTTQMVIALQTAFKDTINDSTDLTNTLNFMNAASNATSLSLQDIAESTPRAANAIASLGGNAEQMTILLVAMREAGVDAAEGANALKSFSARLLNKTIVDKAQKLAKQFGATFNISDLVDKSQANMFDFTKMLGIAMNKSEDLTDKQKAQITATLAGTYQFNRITAALVNVGDAYGGVNNQTSKAIELQGKSAEELQHIADVSKEAMMAAPSAKLRQAWSNFQIELSEIGQPFLAAAADIVKAGSSIAEWFNGLSEGTKKKAMIIAALAAIAGPLVMLTGLFFNLTGQVTSGFGKMISGASRLAGAVGLVNKEEKASALTAEVQNKAYQNQTTAVATLADEIAILTAAYEKATAASKSFAISQGIMTSGVAGAAPGAFIGPQLPPVSPVSNRGANGQFISSAAIAENTRKAQLSEVKRLAIASDIEKKAKAEAATREKMNRTFSGANIMMGTMAISTAAMMMSSNETVDSLAKWAMIASLVVPALSGTLLFMKKIAVEAKVIAVAQLAGIRSAAAGAGAMSAMGVAMHAAKAGAIGFGAALNAALGPIGWIALGITAVVGGIMLWKHHQDDIAKKQKEIFDNQKRSEDILNDSVKRWATSVDRVGDGYGRIFTIASKISKINQTKFQDLVDYYVHEEPTTEGGKNTVDTFKGLSSSDQNLKAMQMYVDLQATAGLNANEAQTQMMAFFQASGQASEIAAMRADALFRTLKSIKTMNVGDYLFDEINGFNRAADGEVQGRAQSVANAFINAIADGRTKTQVQDAMAQLAKYSADSYSDVYNTILNDKVSVFVPKPGMVGGELTSAADVLKQNGITNSEQLAEYLNVNGLDSLKKMLIWFPEAYQSISASAESSYARQQALIASLKEAGLAAGITFGNITSLNDVADAYALKAKTLSYSEQVKDSQQLVSNIQQAGMFATDEAKATALATIQQYLMVNHLKSANNLADALHNLMYGVKDETGKAADEANRLANALPSRFTVSIDAEQISGIAKDAMSSVQDAMADSASTKFNNAWDAKMQGIENSQQAATDALEARQQKAQDAFDARWEARKEAINKAYQARIDAITREIDMEQKADETRQRLFEKEKARLQQIADMENANIDFNTALNEGRLDDAAKTLNNAGVSSATAQMDAEQAAAEAASQARIDALEKKNDRLEKQRDKEIKQLEKMEARMRKHLERIQDMRAKALQQQQEAFINSQQEQRDIEEATLNARLDLFRAYTAKNKTDLEAWMKELGFKYDDFGTNIMQKGKTWADSFKQSLKDALLQAGTEALSDNMWEAIGAKMATKLLKGLGFDSLAQFNTFIQTGTKPRVPKTGTGQAHGSTPGGHETDHGGGVIGAGGSGRGNIPNTYKGLHRSEQMVRAQKGEYIVNRDDAAKNMGLLHAVNSGTDVGQGGFGGPAAFMAGAITRVFGRGLQTNMQNKLKNKKNGTDQGYKAGAGGKHRPITGPVTSDIHDAYTGYSALDFAGASGRPVYAVADGTVSRSYDIGGPLATDHYKGDGPYGSYGRVVYLKTNEGPEVLYAHLSRRSVTEGTQVKGGAVLGYSGNTGNSSGPHLHFGATNGPMAWLRKGGTIRADNTAAMLHKGETVLPSSLTHKFKENAAGGMGGDHFHVTLDLRGATIREDVDIERAINKVIDTRENKLGRKRVVGR